MNNFVSCFCRLFHYVQITGGLVGWNTNKHMSAKCLSSIQYTVMDVHRLSRPNRCHIMVANVNYVSWPLREIEIEKWCKTGVLGIPRHYKEIVKI